jgi:conjugal transfer mating pair stabilization protein TraG
MNEFDIYTLGSGYYLEKIFNAIRLIIDGKESFVAIMKFACIAAIVLLAIRAGINNDLKSAAKWFLGVTILVGLFLTSRATVHIHDKLTDSYGVIQAPRTVQNVPWGLAFLGSTTSRIGNFLAEKFDMAFAATFANSSYQETGMLFGSKIIEDVSKLRIQDANLKAFTAKFYKRCIVPDLRMGYGRVNGYTVKDLASTDDLLTFLKEHSSKARLIDYNNDHISCNKAAHKIADSINAEIDKIKPILAQGFLSYFFPDKQAPNSSQLFESILTNSYGLFIRNSSKEAKDILLQNVMINAISDKVDSARAFGKVTTEETTKAAYYSISQMAQKFVPIYRAVLECILYGIFPVILLLMVTPIGLEILKNYSFGFIYLQMWQPMYAILFCIAGSWGKYYASGIGGSLTFATHSQIASINSEISAVAGYMLASIPILAIFITRGLVSSMGNLASSVFYVQQSAAVQNAESLVRGNYQIGTTSVDTHSFNSTTGNKYDDNTSWQSGMKSFAMQSGAFEKTFADGRSAIDSSHAISNLAGLAKIDWSKAIGSRYDQSISDQMSEANRHSTSMVESSTAAYSKLLGFDKNFSQGSNNYESWSENLTTDQRTSFDEARGFVSRFSEGNNISQQDALKIAIAGNLGVGASAVTSAAKSERFDKLIEASKDQRFSESLNKIRSYAHGNNYQESNSMQKNLMDSVRSDFNQSKSASIQASKALDRVHSLQESKARFEQNSSSISQDLSNKFAEGNIKHYGASGFEDIIRNDPQKTNQLLDDFLRTNTATSSSNREAVQAIETEYEAQKSHFDTKQLDATHKSNLEQVEHISTKNEDAIYKATPDNFEQNIAKRLDHNNKDEINKNIASHSDQLTDKNTEHQSKTDTLTNKVESKNKQLASVRLLDSWFGPDDKNNNK